MSSMRVFITGGSGFIGKKVIAELVLQGYHVFALARNPSALPAGVSGVLKHDLAHVSVSELSDFMKENEVEVVIHLAAAMHFYPSDEGYMWNINVEGTKKLASAGLASGVQKFVYISSTEAMGAPPTLPSSSARPLTEADPCHPFFQYGHSKLKAEEMLRDMGPQLPYVILRLTGVLGPGDDFAIYELLQSVSYGLFFFAPKDDGRVMFTHIDDVVQGIMCAVPDKKEILGKTYIICPDNCATYSDIIGLACKGLNRISPIIKLPIPVIKAVTRIIGPVLNLGKKKIFLFKADTIDRMLEDRWYSNEKAKAELGYRPKYKFEDAVQHTLDHMKRKGELCTWYISPVMLILWAIWIGSVLYLIR